MPDGMLNEMEFEQNMAKMKNRELLEFTARNVYELNKRCPINEERITTLESTVRKRSGITGGITSAVLVVIYAIIDRVTKGG
jgi:nucleoid-associated protein YejK